MKIMQRQYLVLISLVFIFAAPGVVAYILYFHTHWLSQTTTNKGQLITPPIAINALKSDSKWQLVLWSPSACKTECLLQLDKLSRIRLALGRRFYEVGLVLLVREKTDTVSPKARELIEQQKGSIIALSVDDKIQLSKYYPEPGLFIASPENYLILSYPTSTPSDDVFHDIKHLLTKG